MLHQIIWKRLTFSAIAFLAYIACFPASAQQVYFNDFESGDTGGWSTPTPPGVWANSIHIEATPVGNRHFLGQFGNQSVHLSLSELPVHSILSISFDLFILHTWDGNYVPSDPNAGPDEWLLDVMGGPTLLHTTFSNHPDTSPAILLPYSRQAFPGSYPGGDYSGQTGASERDTLGYIAFNYPGGARSIDSVYRLSFSFSHSADTIDLNFQALLHDYGLGATTENESWGLDNVRVDAITPPATITGKVTLQGAINQAQPVTFEFRPADGSASFLRTVMLHADRSFSLTDVPRNSYEARVKGAKWLAKVTTIDASGGDVSGVAVKLLAGDVDGNNVVDLDDLGLLASAFNTEPTDLLWNAQADLTCDDVVDIEDLGLLALNFNTEGDP